MTKPRRGDIESICFDRCLRIMSLASRDSFSISVDPQLALWATRIPPAMRALQTCEAIQRFVGLRHCEQRRPVQNPER